MTITKSIQKSATKILEFHFLTNYSRHRACPGECLVYQMTLHWRKLIFSLQIANSFLVREKILYPLPNLCARILFCLKLRIFCACLSQFLCLYINAFVSRTQYFLGFIYDLWVFRILSVTGFTNCKHSWQWKFHMVAYHIHCLCCLSHFMVTPFRFLTYIYIF